MSELIKSLVRGYLSSSMTYGYKHLLNALNKKASFLIIVYSFLSMLLSSSSILIDDEKKVFLSFIISNDLQYFRLR